MQLRDKVALITGGSQGLGLALAHELGRQGAKVAIVARRQPELDEAVHGLHAAHVTALGIRGDVGDKLAIYALLGQVQAGLGPIDILIHNASSLGPTRLVPLLDTDCEELSRAFAVNVLGAFRLSKAIVPGMLVRGAGLVLHISSDAAVNAYPGWGAYGASKAALDHLSRTLAAELGDSPVRVLSIDPGEMDTAMHRAALPDADTASLDSPHHVAQRIARLITQQDSPNGARLIAAESGLAS